MKGSTEVKSWEEAHYLACLSQSTLSLSTERVIADFPNLSNHPDSSNVVLWGERETAQRRLLQQFDPNNAAAAATPEKATPSAPRAPSRRSLFSAAASAVMMPFDLLTSPLGGPKGDYDDPPPPLAVDIDDLAERRGAAASVMVDEAEPLLNETLALRCLDTMQQLIEDTETPQILTLAELSQWLQDEIAQKAAEEQHDPDEIERLLPHLSTDQFAFLTSVLAASGVVHRIHRLETEGKPDLIVFKDAQQPSVDVRVALYDLQVASEGLQARLQTLEANAATAVSLARQHKLAGNQTAALYQLKRKHRYHAEMDTLYRHLGNMEQQKLLLEGAEDAHRIRQAMQQTAETLQSLRLAKEEALASQKQPDASATQTVDQLAKEVELLEKDNADLAAVTTGVEDLDEAALLRELDTYCKDDTTPSAPMEEEEDDVDVDELLEELDMLTVGKPKKGTSAKRQGAPGANTKRQDSVPLPSPAPEPFPVAQYYQASVFGDARELEEAAPLEKKTIASRSWRGNNRKKEEDSNATTTTKKKRWSPGSRKKRASSPRRSPRKEDEESNTRQLASALCM